MTRQTYIIIDLITIDLINHKLINSLEAMQIQAELYQLGIDRPIFELMQLQDRPDVDDIFNQYYDQSEAIMSLDLKHDRHKIQQLAMDLYTFLVEAGLKQA